MGSDIWSNRSRTRAPGGLAWIQAGVGPHVVLIHGVGLRSEAWAGQLDDLSRTYHLTLIDLPGHGESPRLEQPTTLARYTEQVAQAVASLGAPAWVVGHSMGAMVALDLAFRHPGLCRGVVALNAIYRRSPAAAAVVRARADRLTGDGPADPSEILGRWFGTELERPDAQACRRWLTEVDPNGYREAYRVFANADGPSDEGLASLACPSLFATGEFEPNSTPAMSRSMAVLAPGGKVCVVKRAAHMMTMTHAGEVNWLLDSFFRGHEVPAELSAAP